MLLIALLGLQAVAGLSGVQDPLQDSVEYWTNGEFTTGRTRDLQLGQQLELVCLARNSDVLSG